MPEVSVVVPTRDRRSAPRGPATARNLGARAASGEIVCFTDDDCEPSPDWVRRLVGVALQRGVAAGHTVAPLEAGAAVVASQSIVEHLQLSSLERGGRLGFAPACNLAATRQALARLPFDESYPGAARFRRASADRGLAPASFYTGLVRRGFAAGAGVGVLVLCSLVATAVGVGAERLRGEAPRRRRLRAPAAADLGS